jgi:dolichol kinase
MNCSNQQKCTFFQSAILFFDLKRKLWHLCGLVIPFGYFYTDKNSMLLILLPFTILALCVDILRLKFPGLNLLFIRYLGFLLKGQEKSQLNATTFFLTGALLSILLFSKHAAIFSLIVLAVCDPLASIVGKSIGRIRIKGKTLEGSLAFCLTTFVLSFFFFEKITLLLFGGAIFAAFVEWVPVALDDNLKIPILVAAYYHYLT